MASLNDQFNMARIPLKPLAFENRSESQTNELMVDYGDDKTYHIYIVHHSDKTKYIDLSNIIIQEIANGVTVNGDGITITIEGITDPQELGDILNQIYKNYLFPENASGFNPNTDLNKLYLDSTVNVLLTDNSGVIYLPITSAENVFDSSGKSIQERLDDMTRVAFSIDYLYATTDNQTSFEFSYPFENYSDFMEVRIGTTYVDKTRYQITQETSSDGNIYGGTITFIDESVEIGRRIDLIFIYNSLTATDGSYEYMSGSQLANSTVSSAKLEKTSDSYTLNDSTSIATSAAVYNLYTDLLDIISEDEDHAGWFFDTGTSSLYLNITSDVDVINKDYYILNIITSSSKGSSVIFRYTYNDTMTRYTLYNVDGTAWSDTFPANKVLKVVWKKSEGKFFVVSTSNANLATTRHFHTCVDQETEISFNGLDYDSSSVITVYRNGVRLFEDYDYSIDRGNETITLFVRTEQTEVIVFEALTVNV